jgi:two-component system OmpR family response regulator
MSSSNHILIVDDDEEIRGLLAKTLKQYGFDVSTAENGEQMFQELDKITPDVIVLDLMMPGENGLTLCKKIAGRIPVLILTAMGEETDRIIGLEVGADDYLPKPFNPRELVARIKAILRRTKREPTSNSDYVPGYEHLYFSHWTLNTLSRRLISTEENMEVSLSSGEYDLLLAFLQHPQRVLSRDELLDITKSRMTIPFDRSIDVQISRLRQKIEDDPKKPQLIKTVRGGGYLFTAHVKSE